MVSPFRLRAKQTSERLQHIGRTVFARVRDAGQTAATGETPDQDNEE